MTGRINLHATVVVAGGAGVLIEGPTGSGKSRLALHLVDALQRRGRFAALVADDRVWLSAVHGRLVAEAPEAIAGFVEIRGFGVARRRHERRAVVDRAVRLVEPATAPRHRGEATLPLLGLSVPLLELAAGDAAGAASAIVAWLEPEEIA